MKKNKIYILAAVLTILIAVTVIVCIWLAGRSETDKCPHDYTDFTLDGTPDYKTSAKASRTCKLCKKSEEIDVYAAKGLTYEADDDGVTFITSANGFSGKVLYIASQTPEGKDVDGIDSSVFSEMNVEAVYIEDGIQIIRAYAFAHCESLKQISLPASINEYGDYSFAGCDTLRTVSLHKELKKLGTSQFYECAALESVILPDGITEIPYGVFMGCKNLKTITLPNDLITLGANAFSGCTKLSAIELPQGLQEIYPECFSGCISLVSVKLPALKKLHHGAFLGCTGLQSVYMPAAIHEVKVNGSDGPFFCCSSDLVLYTDAENVPPNWDKHFDSYNSAVTDNDGGELNDDAYFNLKVVYNCAPEDFPKN